jgi:hypothetical protein
MEGSRLRLPRGVSDASRRCKQRPSKFLIERRFFSRIQCYYLLSKNRTAHRPFHR